MSSPSPARCASARNTISAIGERQMLPVQTKHTRYDRTPRSSLTLPILSRTGADDRTVRALADAGYDGAAHRARRFDPGWLAERDLVVALDRTHLRDLRALARASGGDTQVRLLGSFDPALAGRPDADLDVADPYYDDPDVFARVLQQVERACEGLLQVVRTELSARAARSA